MKKFIFIVPLMAISLLASCNKGGGDDPGPVVNTYTITFDCQQCKAFDKDDKEVTSVTVPVVESEHTMYQKFHFEGNKPFKVPLKSNISIKKTGTEEKVDYEYANGNIFVPIVGDLTISAEGISYSKSLEESTWDEIAEISATGRADEFFNVADTKEITLKDQEFSHTVRIIDFNHDDLADGSGKAGITFEFAEIISKDNVFDGEVYKTIWDGIYEVSGKNFDYRKSVLNSYLNDEKEGTESIINLLPSDLKKEGIIKPVNKLVGVSESQTKGIENYEAKPFSTKLFPLAFDELHDPEEKPQDFAPGEAGKLGVYKFYEGHSGDKAEDNNYRQKVKVGGASFSDPLWLRSPLVKYSDQASLIVDGNPRGAVNVFYPRSISPAFCI